jgi:hypothetical protein
VVHRFESLLNLLYLCELEADSPAKVREYISQAQSHLDALIDMQGLRAPRQAHGSERKAS